MSLLYHPLKALGLYSSNVPLYIKRIGKDEFYLFSAVGSYFLVYRFSNLALIGTSDRVEENILSITGFENQIFCGCESKIFAFSRAKHISASFQYENRRNWGLILSLGHEGVLCGISQDDNEDDIILVIWEITSGQVLSTFNFQRNVFGSIVSLIQPQGYENKVLVAGRQGTMQLINYRSRSIIYNFQINCHAISTVEQTPDRNTVAIGCEDGIVLLHNLLCDKTVLKSKTDLGSVSKISFRTDVPNRLIMLVGTVHGHLTQCDLTQNRNISQTRNFHSSAVRTLFCVANDSLLISSSSDNSLRVWNYNHPDGSPVLLRSRCGHWQPPTVIDFWCPSQTGNGSADVSNTMEILSSGHDRSLRVHSLINDQWNFTLGRAFQPGHGNREMKRDRRQSVAHRNGENHDGFDNQYLMSVPISLSTCPVRDGLWDSIVMCHRGDRLVTTWSHSKRSKGKNQYLDPKSIFNSSSLTSQTKKRMGARCAAMSQCGNFVVIGYETGHIVKFNVQSGQERGHYDDSVTTTRSGTTATGLEPKPAHDGRAIISICFGYRVGENVVLVSACRKSVTMWNFDKRTRLQSMEIRSSVGESKDDICLMVPHPSKDMVAIATESGFVHLVQLADFVTFQIIRASFHRDQPISDITFGHDFQLMVVASGTMIKTFDYINNKLVDCFRVNREVTQVKMAPNDLGIVTTHRDDVGLYVWSLKLHYIDMKLASLPLDFEPSSVTMVAKVVYVDNEDDDDMGEHEGDESGKLGEVMESMEIDDEKKFGTGNGVSGEMVQFSGMSSSYFAFLINVEQLQMRNENDTKGMASTAFFIPNIIETLGGLKWVDDSTKEDGLDNNMNLLEACEMEKKRKISALKNSDSVVCVEHFARRLSDAVSKNEYDTFMEFCQSLSAPILNKEIELLNPILNDTGFVPMKNFIRFLDNQLSRFKCVELCQVYLARLMENCMDCFTEQKSQIDTGIEGLMEMENGSGMIENERDEVWQMISNVVKLMKERSSAVSRNLNQIIEMCQFANNNL